MVSGYIGRCDAGQEGVLTPQLQPGPARLPSRAGRSRQIRAGIEIPAETGCPSEPSQRPRAVPHAAEVVPRQQARAQVRRLLIAPLSPFRLPPAGALANPRASVGPQRFDSPKTGKK